MINAAAQKTITGVWLLKHRIAHGETTAYSSSSAQFKSQAHGPRGPRVLSHVILSINGAIAHHMPLAIGIYTVETTQEFIATLSEGTAFSQVSSHKAGGIIIRCLKSTGLVSLPPSLPSYTNTCVLNKTLPYRSALKPGRKRRRCTGSCRAPPPPEEARYATRRRHEPAVG